MKRTILYLLIALISTHLIGVEPMGYLSFKYPANVSIDTLGISIYENIGGNKIGTCNIRPANEMDGAGIEVFEINNKTIPKYVYPLKPFKDNSYFSHYVVNDLKTGDTSYCEYYANGYQLGSYHLLYYDKKGDYIKILANSVEGGAWIKINKRIFKTVDWVTEISDNWVPYLWGYDNYNLRKEPSVDSEVILKLSSQQHLFARGTERKGNWLKVTVCKLNPGIELICEDPDINNDCEEIFTGWIRVVNENGMPQDIWFDISC